MSGEKSWKLLQISQNKPVVCSEDLYQPYV